MQNIKIVHKILIMIIVAMVGMMAIGFMGYSSLKNSEQSIESLHDKELMSVAYLGSAIEKMRTIQVRSMQAIADPARADEVLASQAKDIESFDEIWAKYLDTVKDVPEAVQGAKEAELLWEAYKESIPKVIEAVKKDGAVAGTAEYNRKAKSDIVNLRDKLLSIQKAALENADNVEAKNEETAQSAIQMMVITCLFCMLLLAVVGFTMIKGIQGQMAGMISYCKRLGGGDFTLGNRKSIYDNEFGEVQKALYDMSDSVNKFLNNVAESCDKMTSASEQLSSSSLESADASTSVAQSMAQASSIMEDQRNSVENGTGAVEKIAGSITSIDHEARHAAKNSQEAAQKAVDGSAAIDSSVKQMNQVEKIVTSIAERIDRLGEQSQQIGDIVSTISGIADQTNLLALNAAIEAARAGEQGRGFVVVAEEVRKLAVQSQASAQQIAELIGVIQNNTTQVVDEMHSGREAVIQGTSSVSDLRLVFSEIQEKVHKVVDRVNRVSMAIKAVDNDADAIKLGMESINRGSDNVSSEMQSVSAATEEQSATSEEIAAAAESLSKMSLDLQNLLKSFKY